MTETMRDRAGALALPEPVRAYIQGWNDHDSAAVARSMTPDGTYIDPTTPAPLPPEALAGYVDVTLAALPDLQFAIDGTVIAGDRMAVQWRMLGTHTGPLPGLPEPTGRRCDLPGIDVITFGPDGISSIVGYFDQKTLLEQLSS